MNKTVRIIQLNVRKQGAVHDSLMNDEETRDAVALAIQEPQARRIQGRLLTTPMGHHKWNKMVPSTWREGRWAIRSILWVNKDVEAEQVPIESPDLTAAVIRLPERLIFMASVYVEGGDASALDDACDRLRKAITKVRRDAGTMVEIMIVGDFNRHDQLWGGDDVSLTRQGEADPIIDLMNEFFLSSLLKRGTKTWHGGGQTKDCESTIDLVLASENLTQSMVKCAIHGTEHGSDRIDDEGTRPQRAPVEMSAITMEEIERQLLATKSWKAPGEDGLPAIVWKMTWPVVKHGVLELFQASLDEGTLPKQWRHAKIIPLKKPNKENYTIAKAWRPISLLATLGKVLESVIAERISHAVETYGLLPTSHFGARKQRSAEQALLLLQEQIYTAWRGRRVLSLISFDVKGAYNGVCKERLLQRMKARGIPEGLLRWVEAFCSERTANIQINGQLSEV
ncbi:hypothetical protein VN97_g12529, partial [Penicillium thymicola]